MCPIQGMRTTENFSPATVRPENWREGILLLEPNGDAPLFALSSQMKSKSVDDAKFHWFEKIMADRRFALAEDLDATETAVDVVSGGLELKIGDLLYVEKTGEIMLVNAKPASDVLLGTVVRSYAGTSAVGTVLFATENPNLLLIGSAYEEGSEAPEGIAYDPVEKYNYCQIFRNSLEATNTAIETHLRTGDAIREAKREALMYHSTDVERSAWFGSRDQTTRNGKPVRTTEGFFTWLTRENPANVKTLGATTSLKQLEDELKKAFRYGSNEKMGWIGDQAMLIVQRIVRKNSQGMELIQNQREFGMNVSRLITPFGTVVLKTHPMFNRITSSAGVYTSVDSWLAVMDMSRVGYRYLRNRDTKYQTGQENNGQDGMKSGYITECGFAFEQAITHYLIKGFTAEAADA